MKRILLNLVALAGAIVLTAGATCAPRNVCTPEVTRCDANTAQLCNERGQWVDVMACGSVTGGGEAWECQLDQKSQLNTCLEPNTEGGQ